MPFSLPPFQTVTTGFVVAMVGFFSSFPIVLQGLTAVGASPAQAASGLMAAALAMGLAGIALGLATRLPASVAWSTPGAALLAVSAPVEAGFAGAMAGFLLAWMLTVISGLWRPLGRLVEAIPAALAQAMLGGVLLSLVIAPVTALAASPLIIAPIVLTWFVLGCINRLLAVPGAVAAAAVTVLIHGNVADFAVEGLLSRPVWTMPELSWAAALGIGLPLYIVTMATQNVPGLAVMRSFGYAPKAGPLLQAVGGFSVLSAPFGAPATCLAAITAALCANEDSHPNPALRYWSAVVAGLFYCLLGLFAGAITAFAALAPPQVLATIAGLALVGVFGGATRAALKEDRYREAAVITFVVTASGVTVFGLGGAVWGLLAGGLVQVLREAGLGPR